MAQPTINSPSASNTPEATFEPAETAPLQDDQLPLPQNSTEFTFHSGAGAWRSVLTLNRDGTFTGWYFDSEMGETGEGYPKGSVYT